MLAFLICAVICIIASIVVSVMARSEINNCRSEEERRIRKQKWQFISGVFGFAVMLFMLAFGYFLIMF